MYYTKVYLNLLNKQTQNYESKPLRCINTDQVFCKITSLSRSRFGKPSHRNVRENTYTSDHSCENRDVFPDAHVREPATRNERPATIYEEAGLVSHRVEGTLGRYIDMKHNVGALLIA